MTSMIIKQTIIDTIIFDFDGTLAKLNIDFQIMRNHVIKLNSSYEIGSKHLQTDYVLEMVEKASKIIRKRSSKEADSFLCQAWAMIEAIETQAAREGELFDYTKTLLDELKFGGISCGIITRNCAKAVNILFPDISNYTPVVICRDHVRRVKPHPEHIRTAINKLGSLPESTLMIGDHPIDIKTGRNVGTLTCGVLTGRCSNVDFIRAGADLILDNAYHIIRMLK